MRLCCQYCHIKVCLIEQDDIGREETNHMGFDFCGLINDVPQIKVDGGN